MNTVAPTQPATRTPSPLDAIVHEAGRKLQTLRMTRIVGCGDKVDADNLIADLDTLATIFDGVIWAIGRYARSELGLSEDAVKKYFTDQVRGALEGNGMFEIEEVGKQASEYLRGVR